MSGESKKLRLLILQRLDAKMDHVLVELQALKHRVTGVETQLAHLAATEAYHYASIAARLDTLESRLDRLERRPDGAAE